MIEIKGSKTQAQESDPAQRYVLKNADKKSKAPAVLSVLLMGVALYLKSIFPSTAETDGVKHRPESEPKGEAEPKMAQADSVDRPPLDETPTGTVAAAKGPIGGGGRVVEPLPPVEFMRIESPEVEFTQPEVDMFWHDFKIPSVYDTAANDNSGSGGLPDFEVPDDGEDTGPGKPTVPVDEDDDPTDPGNEDDDGDDDTDPGDPTDPADDDCPSGCDGDPCDEDPVEEPCGGDPCDDDDPQANRAPRVAGPVYLMDVTGCAILAIGLTDLLRNAVDPDGDTLSVQNLTVSSGTLTQEGESWVFQGGPQLMGPVTITYQITDGEFTVNQTAHFSVIRSFIGGSDGDDMLLGTMCADDIDGGDGHDNIDGRAGNDVIAGGGGNDHIVAGAGNDTVFGGGGNDIVFGGSGNDHISGGDGDDRLFGEQGDDIVFGDAGEDYLSGGEGNDLLSGGQGNDLVEGDTGDDEIIGGSGNDELLGGQGNDVIDGGTGNDVVHGGGGEDTILDGAGEDTVHAGAGNDRVVAALDSDNDTYDGGEGCDTLDYTATTEGVAVDLASASAAGLEIGSDTVTAFETVLGGSGSDSLTGSAAAETFVGNEGDDEIAGGGGNDELYGGGGNDELYGGGGDDLLCDGDGNDWVFGGSGNDAVMAALDGDDDVYDGGEGCDTLDYSATSEGVTVDLAGENACGVEIGDDTISGFETVVGGTGDDHFIVGDEPAVLVGGGGENTFEFLAAEPASETASVLHEILDFKVGDRIRMSKYDIFERVLDELEDRFEDIYGDGIDDDDIPIRFRHDMADEMTRTVIEADFDNDDVYETTISLHGHHILVVSEQA